MALPPQKPRLVPDRPFPSYSYVPGLFPHPISDPAGHSFDHRVPVPFPLDPDHWDDCLDYLFGLDLFNHGYFWEAHEVWEGLWHAAGRRGVVATFLKGLIKLTASGVKTREGKPQGVKSLAAGAAKLWREVPQDFLGFQSENLIKIADQVSLHGWPETNFLLVPKRET